MFHIHALKDYLYLCSRATNAHR